MTPREALEEVDRLRRVADTAARLAGALGNVDWWPKDSQPDTELREKLEASAHAEADRLNTDVPGVWWSEQVRFSGRFFSG